ESAAPLVPLVEMTQLYRKHRGLDWIETRIDASHDVAIAFLGTVIAEPANAANQCLVVRDDRSGVAYRAEVFRRIEAEGGGIAEAAASSPAIPRSVGLRRVFQQKQAMPVGQCPQPIHIGRMTVKMHRDDRS